MSLIEVKNLLFRYRHFSEDMKEPEETTVIDDVSLSVEKGDFIGILGHNGSGKSTLAKQLTALLKPSDGVVYVKGMDTSSENSVFDIRKTAGIVFQNPDNQLIGNTVEEDVAFGLENLGVPTEEMWARIAYALEMTGMNAYRLASPGSLSGGQKQRVAISGILAMEPECIIFDEPTAMLDPVGRQEIMKAVRCLNQEKGITVIYITHHIEEVKEADYLYVMRQGKVVMQGSPSTLWHETGALIDNGAGVPFVQELIRTLKRKGIQIPFDMDSEERLLDYLCTGMTEKRLKVYPEPSERSCGDVVTEPRQRSGDVVTELRQRSRNVVGEKGIYLDHISYAYPDPAHKKPFYVLKNITMQVKKGEFIAITGQTGSGKSTLLQQMNGLLHPTEGRYLFDGEDVHQKDYPIRELRQKVGLCFQYPEYQLFEETVIKDIAFGPENMGGDADTSMEKAREAMKLTGLPSDLENKSPFTLSGGQKRRVALAGILAMEPEYLILDEPAAGLDAEGKEMLFRILKNLNQTKHTTIIMVTHDMNDAAANARRIVILKEGEILADGPVRKLFRDRELLTSAGLSQPDCVRFFCDLCERTMVHSERTIHSKGTVHSEEAMNTIPCTTEELGDIICGMWDAEDRGNASGSEIRPDLFAEPDSED